MQERKVATDSGSRHNGIASEPKQTSGDVGTMEHGRPQLMALTRQVSHRDAPLMRVVIFVFFCCLAFPTLVLAEESPLEGVQAIIQLYKDRNFDQLVRDRYTEIHKAESDKDITKLIDNLSRRFASDEALSEVVAIYEKALATEPRIVSNPYPQPTEQDAMAEFPITPGPLRLYLMKSGKWGFHL